MENKSVIVPIQTTGTKEATEIGGALKGILTSISEALEDDKKINIGEIFDIIKDNWDKLVDAVKDIKSLPEEAKTDPMAMMRGLLNPISEGVEELIK